MSLVLYLDQETNDKRSKAAEKLPADDPQQPRICSIGWILCIESSKKILAHFYTLVQPPEDMQIAEEAYAVHGLDYAFLNRYGMPLEDAMYATAAVLALGEQEPLTLVAHGLQFDYKTLRGELRRSKLSDYYPTTKRFCTMSQNVKVLGLKQEGTNRPKWPSLAETYQHYFGKPPASQHHAFGDATSVKQIHSEMQKRGIDTEPKIPDGYHIQDPDRSLTQEPSNEKPAAALQAAPSAGGGVAPALEPAAETKAPAVADADRNPAAAPSVTPAANKASDFI